MMLRNGTLTWEQIKGEVDLGYIRPSILADIRYRHLFPKWLHQFIDKRNAFKDRRSGYIAHKEVYAQKRIRQKAIKEYETRLAAESSNQA